jgi:hypothetical protein
LRRIDHLIRAPHEKGQHISQISDGPVSGNSAHNRPGKNAKSDEHLRVPSWVEWQYDENTNDFKYPSGLPPPDMLFTRIFRRLAIAAEFSLALAACDLRSF